MTRARKIYLIMGALFIGIGVMLPQSWFTPLAQREVLPPPPISGWLVLQFSFILQGILLIGFGLFRFTFAMIESGQRLHFPNSPPQSANLRWVYGWLLIGVTLLGLELRLIGLNSELWLDEITPVLDYRNASTWQVIISYISSNNHLLNTLLVKFCIALFGEQEWAIRLPAALFGVATIPVLYWLARKVLSQRASLGAALLVAVSYHHIFFSQDARAYTAYMFFSLLATGLFVEGLKSDRTWIWTSYIGIMVLDLASIVLSGFVLASHILIGGAALSSLRRRGITVIPLFKRLAAVFSAICFLGFQLYAAVLPQMYVYTQSVYAHAAVGYFPFTLEFIAEIARGLSAGFGTGLLLGAIPFLLIACVGFIALLRRNWVVVVALTAPGFLQALALISRNLVFSPRFFILMLPVAILVAVQGVDTVADYAARLLKRGPAFSNWVGVGMVALLSVASLSSLPSYYAVPKQAYRTSLQYLETVRQPADIVIVLHLAEYGFRYYGERYSNHGGQDFSYVRTVAALDEVLSRHRDQRSWVVVTFPRALRLSLPELDARIRRDWRMVRKFPGTVGDGDITVWLRTGSAQVRQKRAIEEHREVDPD